MDLFPNLYHLRKVADSAAKSCAFCFKPATTVLITADGTSDFFYTCELHLKDEHFAKPVYDEEYLNALKQKNELDIQMKQLKLKWDEKNRYVSWDKFVNYTKSFTKDKETKKGDDDDDDEKIKDEIKNINTKTTDFNKILNKQQRVYQLNQQIFKIRVNKKRQVKINKSMDQTIKSFPTAPNNSIN